jgi:FkbM family methyltransferase
VALPHVSIKYQGDIQATLLPNGPTIRKLITHVTRPITLKRRLPGRFGGVRIYVSNEGGLKYLFVKKEKLDPELFSAASTVIRPGDRIWDVGANLGLFSAIASSLSKPTGNVLAIEPDPELLNLLSKTAQGAEFDVLPLAISDRPGMVNFVLARTNRACNHLQGFGSTQTGGARGELRVLAVNLDWLSHYYLPPTVLKLDVEGAEIPAVRGAEQVLSRRPRLIFEVRPENREALGDMLTPLGYKFYDSALSPLQCHAWPRNVIALPS